MACSAFFGGSTGLTDLVSAASAKWFSVASVSLSRTSSRMIHIVFSRDIHDLSRPYVHGSVQMKPELDGKWEWFIPAFLRFRASKTLPENARIDVTINPKKIVSPDWKMEGREDFVLHTRDFVLKGVEVSQHTVLVDKKPFSVISMMFSFNQDVKQAELLDLLDLQDPLRLKNLFRLRRMYRGRHQRFVSKANPFPA